MALNDKQLRFCEEYLVDLNGTQAAIRAGYSPKTAKSQASRLLTNDAVSREIKAKMEARSARTEVTQDEVIEGFREVRDRCLQRAPVMRFNRVERRMEQATDDDDNHIWTFDSTGANRALEMLGKHIDMFGAKLDVTSGGKAFNVTFTTDDSNPEEKSGE